MGRLADARANREAALLKALTLWQPWASLIIDLRKTIETRPKAWYYVGWVAIHAGLHVDREACDRFGYDPDTIPTGAVLGVSYKTGCVRFPSVLITPDVYGNFRDGRYGYPLQNSRAFSIPLPAKGHQGFWDWNLPNDIVYRAAERLHA